MQQLSLRGGSVQHSGPAVPLTRESPTTTAHLFFLMEVVIIQGPVLSVQQYLWCRWAIIHIILWLTFRIIIVVYKHVGRRRRQRGGLPAAPSRGLSLFTLFVQLTAFCMAGEEYRIPLILCFSWWLFLLLSQGEQSMGLPGEFFLIFLLMTPCSTLILWNSSQMS